jgi:hypothetical protein
MRAALCFSAEASFGMSVALVPAGIYCLRNAIAKDYRWLPLAALPVIAGLQQACEGLVWMELGRSDPGAIRLTSLLFLFFAVCFWPIWIPFSSFFVALRKPVKWLLVLMTFCGLAGGLGSYLPVASHPDLLRTEIVHHSVHYRIAPLPEFAFWPQVVWQLLYLANVSMPLILSARKGLLVFGIGLIVAAVSSHLLFWYAFESVWCFFAALLSIYLCSIFGRLPAAAKAS